VFLTVFSVWVLSQQGVIHPTRLLPGRDTAARNFGKGLLAGILAWDSGADTGA
jgi:hypothetical protein